MIVSTFLYDMFVEWDADTNWHAGALNTKTCFTIVFILFTTGYSFILRPNNDKLALTFNQYRDLHADDSVHDDPNLSRELANPDCA